MEGAAVVGRDGKLGIFLCMLHKCDMRHKRYFRLKNKLENEMKKADEKRVVFE